MKMRRSRVVMTALVLGLFASWSVGETKETKASSMDKAKEEALARLDHLKDLSALLRAGFGS